MKRRLRSLLLSSITSLFFASFLMAADSPSVHDVSVNTLDGKATTLGEWKGKVILIVNVASECGYTGQYAGLQSLQEKFGSGDLAVLGFPCNDFGGQEPGSAKEIQTFCSAKYHVTFPMFEKISILGEAKHPLYALLTGPQSPKPGDVQWNFTKFLVGKDGKILARFESDVEPESAEVVSAIQAALGK